jgi:hypothetical protein
MGRCRHHQEESWVREMSREYATERATMLLILVMEEEEGQRLGASRLASMLAFLGLRRLIGPQVVRKVSQTLQENT